MKNNIALGAVIAGIIMIIGAIGGLERGNATFTQAIFTILIGALVIALSYKYVGE